MLVPDDSSASPAVLIVDDNRQMRDMLAELLVGHGYAVEVAKDGTEALAMLRRQPPALILLDLDMPFMSGASFRVVQQKLPPPLPSIPVIIISARGDIAAECERMQAAAYLQKPITSADLLRVVDEHCAR